ncbi:MAG: TIGR02281 family clan AA aspartic protease [Betaproteobacteria bacterium]|nr:TIGR02281 family clan AA aspartic protease [Betaproteobacteria bacterium]
MGRHSSALLAVIAAFPAFATDVSVVGVIGDRAAVLVIDGAEPRTVRLGQKLNGVSLIAVTRQGATLEFDGKRRTLALGQHLRDNAPAAPAGTTSVTLAADTRGHFVGEGQVNNLPVRFLVDTGATMVSLPEDDARKLGIDYSHGQRGAVKTANGVVTVYRVKLDTVRVGSIELHNVDALVHEGSGLDVVLLGMSFLNRVEMQRAGDRLTLKRRF